MNNWQYFQATSLSYLPKEAHKELTLFRSGKAYTKLCAEYESIIQEQNAAIKKQKECDDFFFSRKEIKR